MLSPKVKGLLEGFVMGSTAATILYTVFLQAGWIVSAAGAEVIVEQKLQPLKDNVDTILLLSLESRMRDISAQLCDASPSLRGVLQGELDRLQKQHLDAAKVYYAMSAQCEPTS